VRESYKSDTRSEHTSTRQSARRRIVEALKLGQPLGIFVKTAMAKALVGDGSGDTLDAVICAVQAAWAAQRPRYGLPLRVPAGEGWILSASPTSASPPERDRSLWRACRSARGATPR
jgi:hypothetical protein